MIFSGNKTALGASTIPMAEGYDCSCGVSLALVESARNDLAMFKALVQADYKEMSICKESTGVVMEGEIATLHEAVGGGIFKKIAELFKKLVAKIKSIFHNFMARLRGLVSKDKDLVKRYETEVIRKSNIEKLEVKWRKYTDTELLSVETFDKVGKIGFEFDHAEAWDEDSWERVKKIAKSVDKSDSNITADNIAEFKKDAIDEIFDDEETVKVSEIGGMRKICSFLKDYESKFSKMQSAINKATSRIEALVKKYDKKANAVASGHTKPDDKKPDTYKYKTYGDDGREGEFESDYSEDDVKAANQQYDLAVAYQTYMLACMDVSIEASKIAYKYNKAAFMKAVTVNAKKLEESSIYAQAMAEAVKDEVDKVFDAYLKNEDISDLSAASTNVLDADVKNDPNALTYYDDIEFKIGKSFDDVDTDGTVDTTIGGGKVEESYFGQMFY